MNIRFLQQIISTRYGIQLGITNKYPWSGLLCFEEHYKKYPNNKELKRHVYVFSQEVCQSEGFKQSIYLYGSHITLAPWLSKNIDCVSS